ncbi:Rex2p [Sugiyamaella lignohabitans]|uniref:Rex2p n=1 Tax=Sugiyamaella lignohabitans TaxID=796027 RepID=A0A167DIL0_9ASCO|nr:Rex2p [Sugiyamaella lignohabitans]ANB12955.1 Rex2p [Sugiyamaella lignohabitans]
MDKMNDWCIEHHGKSGLTNRVLESSKTLEEVENELLEYIKTYVKAPGKGVLAGNSIHQDRMFLRREFPKFIDYLHYRQVDVSTIKEVGYRHNPDLMAQLPQKRYGHTARSDIEDSIAELKWYYENYLIPPSKN